MTTLNVCDSVKDDIEVENDKVEYLTRPDSDDSESDSDSDDSESDSDSSDCENVTRSHPTKFNVASYISKAIHLVNEFKPSDASDKMVSILEKTESAYHKERHYLENHYTNYMQDLEIELLEDNRNIRKKLLKSKIRAKCLRGERNALKAKLGKRARGHQKNVEFEPNAKLQKISQH